MNGMYPYGIDQWSLTSPLQDPFAGFQIGAPATDPFAGLGVGAPGTTGGLGFSMPDFGLATPFQALAGLDVISSLFTSPYQGGSYIGQQGQPIVPQPVQPWGPGALGGALKGAGAGSMFGPWGTAIGAPTGYISGKK